MSTTVSSLHIGLRWSSQVAGGADRVFADLASTLPAAGVPFVGVVAGKEQLSRETDGLIYSFAPEDSRTTTRLLGARRNIPKLIEQHNPDVIASHFALYTFPALHHIRSRPFVMHFHGPWAMESRVEGASGPATYVMRRIEKAVYSVASRAIVLSEVFAQLLHREYGVPQEVIRIVPGAVDLNRFAPHLSRSEARSLLGWPNDRPVLLSIRRLAARMGLQNLITALVDVRNQFPDVLLYIGGTGPMRPLLEQQVERSGLQQNVKFLGFVPEDMLCAAYRAADVSVVPTASLEGFGLVAAESLAAGTPAMVTPVGGLPEVVSPLSAGLVFRSTSCADIADGISAGLSGQVPLPMPETCRNYAVSNFSSALMASRVAAIYRELIG
jgi:glycosyltransferase involved in cell wall biosynthesis